MLDVDPVLNLSACANIHQIRGNARGRKLRGEIPAATLRPFTAGGLGVENYRIGHCRLNYVTRLV